MKLRVAKIDVALTALKEVLRFETLVDSARRRHVAALADMTEEELERYSRMAGAVE